MTTIDTNNYSEPSPELIDDIRKRLADVPQEILERARHALMHEPIQHAGSILYKAGVCLSSHELYEYRKTLFPPNALVDPLTQGPPEVGRGVPAEPPAAEVGRGVPAEPFGAVGGRASSRAEGGSPDNLSASTPTTGEPLPTNESQLHQARQSLVQLLSARATPPVAASRESAADSSDRSVGSLSAASGNPEPRTVNSEPAALLSELRDVIQRYVVLPDMAAETLALWVVHTYAFTLRQVTTYIGVVSPEKRCGKTTLLELLGLLANRSLTAANITPSALFRVIEVTKPTLLIDEADTFLQGRDELAGILNAGYRKGNSYVVRVAERNRPRKRDEQNGERKFGEWTNEHPDGSPGETEFGKYSCWCPKVMAAIGRLPDTLADRCIIITMQRKMAGEKCERMYQLDAPEYRRRCAEFVSEHCDAIAQARPETPSGLNDRAADIWEPLLAIADLAGGEWPQLARQAAQKLSTQDEELTLVGYFLKDLRNLMVLLDTDRMLCRDIVAQLNPMHNRPWEDLRRGREINEWWLGRLLGGLGIHSKAMRVNDTIAKGYTLADIDAAFRRYVPNPDLHAQSRSTPAPDPSPATDDNDDDDTDTDPDTDPNPEIEKDLTKLMRKLLGTAKPS